MPHSLGPFPACAATPGLTILKLTSLGLLPRIGLSLALVGFIPLILVSTQLIGLTTHSQRDQVLGAQLKAAAAAASEINEYIYARNGITEFTASNPVLIEDPKSAQSATVIRGLLDSFSDLEAMALLNANRELVIQAQREGQSEGVLAQALDRGPARIDIMDFGEREFAKIEAAVPEVPGAVVLLIFNTGAIVDALDPSGLLGSTEFAWLGPNQQTLAGEENLTAGFTPEQVNDAPKGQISTQVGNDLASSVPLGEEGWYVVARQPKSEAFRLLSQMKQRAGGIIGLTSLLIFGLMSAAFRSIVRPIRELTRVQSELTGLPTSDKGNELDQLKSAFEVLERRVREKQVLEETFLDRYQVLDVLGEGAMGMVFRAWDPRLDRPVALKTIRLDRELPDHEREKLATRLVQEAKTVARFTDPNIVAVYDVQQAGDMAFIAMEMIDGNSLDQYLRMHGPRPEAECARIGAGVARALAAAHKNNVVHQDIKPGNVLLSTDGQIKVVDFGVASLVTSLTADEDIVFGTPGYMPPEALDGDGFDARGDLFSLGAVLYQTATGIAPFIGRGLSETIRKTYAGAAKLEPIQSQDSSMSSEFSDLVFELLEIDPSKRPNDALLIAARLDSFVPREGILWRPKFRSTGPGHNETHERPKSRLLPSAVIDRLADK